MRNRQYTNSDPTCSATFPQFVRDAATTYGDEPAIRVLGETIAGAIVPGLCAAGVGTGSVMGRKYPGADCSVGPSLVWRYVAAHRAVQVGQ